MKRAIIYQAGFIILTAASLCLILYGLQVLIQPGILLGTFPAQLDQYSQEARGYLAGLYRLLGYFNILPGLISLLLLLWARRGRENHSLRIAIMTIFLAYLGPIVFDNTVGSIGFFEILEHILFVLVIIAGIALWNSGKDGRHVSQRPAANT